MREWLKNAPTAVLITIVITVGIIVLTLIGGYTYLTAMGIDTTDFRAFINTLMNAGAMVLAAIGAIGGVSAAQSSSKVEKATNGGLQKLVDEKIDQRLNDRG